MLPVLNAVIFISKTEKYTRIQTTKLCNYLRDTINKILHSISVLWSISHILIKTTLSLYWPK